MKITFHGAAGEVTGSQHLIETSERRILLDCGLFQGPRAEARRKNESFGCGPQHLDAVILSHAHADHCGIMPRLYRCGYRGPVFSTEATADIAELMLQDSAKIQAEDAKYLQRKLKPGHPSFEPLYSSDDVSGLMKLFEPFGFDDTQELGDDCRLTFRTAGHILGAAIVELELKDEGEWKRVVFTGDLGRRDMPLLEDPSPVEGADVLITESTYGNRVHPPVSDLKQNLLDAIRRTTKRGGRVIIPAFSLGRTQQVVYSLNELFNKGELPWVPVYVDSPLATRLTKIFRRHDDILNENVQESMKDDPYPFDFETLTYVETQHESKAINDRDEPCVIISASGMCEGGRVVHHLAHGVGDERNSIVLMGYQAPGTLGRQIAERRDYVKIFDRDFTLRAEVEQLEGLSAHADVMDFKWWFSESTKRGHFGQAFIVHGEPDSAEGLRSILKDYCDEMPIIPRRGQTFTID
ncbi:MAG: MBL fold metallo-hydrolase [Planctomycetaceae bacterium]|nr:MBL fold metallo-hydrolase [Planctomycetaceae bacterium]